MHFKLAFFATIVKDVFQPLHNQTTLQPASLLIATTMSPHHTNRTNALIQNAPLPLHYNITKMGKSTLRNLTDDEISYLRISNSSGSTNNSILAPLMMLIHADVDEYALDKAHEIILGVNETNIIEAEFAAINRGKTSWSEDHPLNADQDMLHSIIHRLEGGSIGEGGYKGYENAKYWLFGGSKMMESVEDHVVRAWLRNYVLRRDYLQEMGLVVANERRCYEIIAGGGRRRTVFVEQGEFDYVRYYDMCEMRQEGHHKSLKKWKDEWSACIIELQLVEIDLLFKYASGDRLKG